MNLKKIGMSNAEALRAATSVAAAAIGQDDKIGFIKKEYRANLTVLNGNPLDDLEATKAVVMTIKDGKILKDAREEQVTE